VVTYRLMVSIYDSERENPHTAVYSNSAALDVETLRSIGDRDAFDMLTEIIRNGLVPEGSTILERESIAANERTAVVFTDYPTSVEQGKP
jgi:hypothetical protein